jgi:hypothetical protein
MDEATARYRVVFADEAAEKLRVEQEAAENLKSEMEAAAEAQRLRIKLESLGGGEYGYISLPNGKQLYSDKDQWARVDLPGESLNLSEENRLWKFENGILSLKDGR